MAFIHKYNFDILTKEIKRKFYFSGVPLGEGLFFYHMSKVLTRIHYFLVFIQGILKIYSISREANNTSNLSKILLITQGFAKKF